RTAAFYFTDLGDSYAARTGRPQNVGVVGVAVFQEKPQPILWRDFQKRSGAAGSDEAPTYPESQPVPAPSPSRQERGPESIPPEQSAATRERSDIAANESDRKDSLQSAQKSLGKLGTGHGRREKARATIAAFGRAPRSPAETVAIQYDRHENLVAMGVLPRPYYARRQQP